MDIEIRWEYPSVVASADILNHLLLKVISPPELEQKTRQPLALILVLDKSWSMKGEKMTATIEAASTFVNWLTRHDYIGIVAYSSDVQVVQPFTKVNEKKSIINRIQALQVGTATNLSGGWLQGLKMAEEAAQLGNCVRRVLLLTDGIATMGVQEEEQLLKIAETHAEKGISTTTIGFGADFNENSLRAISRAGKGNFYFIDSPEKTSEVFFKEFGQIGSLYAQALELKLDLPPEVKFLELLDDVSHEVSGNTVKIQAGDLRADDARTFVMEMEVKAGKENIVIPVTAEYYRVDEKMTRLSSSAQSVLQVAGESTPDPDVRTEMAIAWAGKTMIQAAAMAESDLSGAIELLNNMLQRLLETKASGSDTIQSLILRIEEMQKRLKEDSNIGRKFLLAGGTTLYQDRGELTSFRDIEMHDRIHEMSHKGELDLYNSPELRQAIRAKMLEGYRFFVLDLSETPFIDSSAIGTLIQVSNWLNRRGGLLVVANLTSTVEKVFQLTRLNSFIPSAESVTDARMIIESRKTRS